MARKKDVKPLFAVKHDFVDSLEHFLQQAIMLHQAVRTALDLKQINEKVAPIVKERLEAFEKALLTDQGGEGG